MEFGRYRWVFNGRIVEGACSISLLCLLEYGVGNWDMLTVVFDVVPTGPKQMGNGAAQASP